MLVDEKLARAIERASAQSAVRYAEVQAEQDPDCGAAVLAVGSGFAVSGGRWGGPNVGRGHGLGLAGPVDAGQLDALEAFYAARTLPSRVTLCPFAHPSLAEGLAARGYRITRFDQLLVLPLGATDPLPASPPGIAVRAAAADEAGLWWRTGRDAFGTAALPDAHGLRQNAPFFAAPARAFLASLQGNPAGVAAATLFDGIALLLAAGTVPAARGHGVQRALIAARVAWARSLGATLAVATCAAGGPSQENLERCGFRVAYTALILERPSA